MSRNYDIVEVPAGRGGINRSGNLSDYPVTDLRYDEGITSEFDTWRKEGGAAKINTTTVGGTYTVKGAWDFFSASAVQETVAYLDDNSAARLVTVVTGGIDKSLVGSLQTGKIPTFAEGWNGSTKALYIANGYNPIQVYTGGASSSNLTTPNDDWSSGTGNHPAVVVAHNQRLWAFGCANFPHDVFASVSASHSDFKGGESYRAPVYPGQGEGLRAGASWRGKLWLFKFPVGIYYVDDADSNIANWRIVKVSEAFGAASQGCVIQTEDDVIVFANDGYVYALSQVRTDGQQSTPPILPMELGIFIREQLNLTKMHLIQGIWYGHKRQVMFALPAAGSSVNNRRLTADLHRPGEIQVHFSRRDTCPSLGLRRASSTDVQKPMMGDASGFLWMLDQTTRTKDGNAYTGQYETPPVACYPRGHRRMNLKELEVIFQEKGEWDLTVEVHRDGKLSQTLTFSMQSIGAAASSISLDSDVTGGTTVANVRHRLLGDARRVKLIGKNAGASQDFSVMGHLIKGTPGSTR